MGRLENKKAVVTGGTSGIGRASAIMFAKEGAQVVVVGRNAARGAKVIEEIEKSGGKADFFVCDLTDKDDIEKLHAFALEKLGRVDVLMNSAGVLAQKPFLEATDEEYDRIMETNLHAYIRTMQAFIPDMVENGGGSIVNVSSVSSIWPELNSYFYGASKAGVSNISRNVAKEFASKHVRINCVLPGPIDTGMTPKVIKDDPTLYQKLIDANCPLGRFGQADDIAYGALYLASDESSFVTGSSIAIDGGTCISN